MTRSLAWASTTLRITMVMMVMVTMMVTLTMMAMVTMVLTTSMMVSTKAFGSNCWPWCSWW